MESFASDHQVTTQETNNEAQEATTPMSFQVGERTFTPESAAKKIEHADNYIAELKAKQEALEKQLEEVQANAQKTAKLEEAISKLQQQRAEQGDNTNQPVGNASVESQEEVVMRILEQREKEKQMKSMEEKQKETFQNVYNSLSEAYGQDNVSKVVNEKAQELGLSLNTVDAMARDPEQSKVLLQLFKAQPTRQEAAPKGQINTAGLQPKQERPSLTNMSSSQLAEYMKQLQQQ